jgi:hypothetical protein
VLTGKRGLAGRKESDGLAAVAAKVLPTLEPLTLRIVLTGIVVLYASQLGPVVAVSVHHAESGQIKHRFDLQGSGDGPILALRQELIDRREVIGEDGLTGDERIELRPLSDDLIVTEAQAVRLQDRLARNG